MNKKKKKKSLFEMFYFENQWKGLKIFGHAYFLKKFIYCLKYKGISFDVQEPSHSVMRMIYPQTSKRAVDFK